MTQTEILHRIVEAENEARTIYNEAVAIQTGFEDNIQTHIEELKKKYVQLEEGAVSDAEAKAVLEADREIERLDKKLEAELAIAKNKYETRHGGYIDKLFRLAVNLDA